MLNLQRYVFPWTMSGVDISSNTDKGNETTADRLRE